MLGACGEASANARYSSTASRAPLRPHHALTTSDKTAPTDHPTIRCRSACTCGEASARYSASTAHGHHQRLTTPTHLRQMIRQPAQRPGQTSAGLRLREASANNWCNPPLTSHHQFTTPPTSDKRIARLFNDPARLGLREASAATRYAVHRASRATGPPRYPPPTRRSTDYSTIGLPGQASLRGVLPQPTPGATHRHEPPLRLTTPHPPPNVSAPTDYSNAPASAPACRPVGRLSQHLHLPPRAPPTPRSRSPHRRQTICCD